MARISSLSKDNEHRFSKKVCDSINLLEGLGVEGDVHCGKTVQHRSRTHIKPAQPNLRQVHLLHVELINELCSQGFNLSPGVMGENILTEGVDLLSLPTDTRLKIGDAILKLTGLRNPCVQLDQYQQGLMQAVLEKDESGALVRKAGVMAVVERGGVIKVGDPINIELPSEPHLSLQPV